jgi:formylmethanofuran dehydrogenase subunit D
MTSKLVALKDRTGVYGCYTEAYHQLFPRSTWIVLRRFGSRQLTEGDFVTVFSQFGEVVDVRCSRSHRTGEIVGNCVFVQFLKLESAILAADNMNSGRAPNGKKVFLTEECRRTGVGLQVDRCDEVEVPSLAAGVESYGEWYDREMLGTCESQATRDDR